jgi:hypothetical protein
MALFARSLDPATVTALAAILGSFAGASVSTLSAWSTQRHHDRRDTLARKISHREQLYSDFISESARAMVDAMQHPNLTAEEIQSGAAKRDDPWRQFQ